VARSEEGETRRERWGRREGEEKDDEEAALSGGGRTSEEAGLTPSL
jgi:hypothetical protein